MKRILVTVILLAASAFPQESSKYFDSPFGGGGGYSPGWYVPNMDVINQKVKSFGVSELSTSGFYTSGGAGFIYIGFVPGLRIGGMGFAGSTSETAAVDGMNKEVVYSLGGGGLTVEYSLPFIKDFGISVGAIIGAGSLDLEIYSMKNGYTWDDIWNYQVRNRVPAENTEIASSIKNSFWFISPTLNIDIPFYRFLTFRVGGGYQVSFGDDWTYDNDMMMNDVPADLNGNSFFIQTGIFIGFFSF